MDSNFWAPIQPVIPHPLELLLFFGVLAVVGLAAMGLTLFLVLRSRRAATAVPVSYAANQPNVTAPNRS